ncbi:hypothetical protein PXD56_13750 [Maribacter sp. SA7]|uniref:hypothetical protein n=1 Tax=Maribacter zhoushanensis TaxID=3030012 RepID=UPI0023EB2310|nr:hypothetical protein [Maribacter zhoushanensis]MDF4204032.1 hypothetical protein [Maribacter zhoushanensis]
MGLYEYMMLPETDQWNNLWENSTYLTNHTTSKRKYNLYALYAFFVEVEYDPKTNKILGKGHFKTGEALDRYSGSIDINKI